MNRYQSLLLRELFSVVMGLTSCESVSHSVFLFFVTPWTVARQTPLSTEFSRQEYWSE